MFKWGKFHLDNTHIVHSLNKKLGQFMRLDFKNIDNEKKIDSHNFVMMYNVSET